MDARVTRRGTVLGQMVGTVHVKPVVPGVFEMGHGINTHRGHRMIGGTVAKYAPNTTGEALRLFPSMLMTRTFCPLTVPRFFSGGWLCNE